MKKLILCFMFLLLLPQIGHASEPALFSDVHSKGIGGVYKVTGTIHTPVNHIYYTVEDGHEEYLPETELIVNKEDKFSIGVNIPKEKLPTNGTLILYLYMKSKEGVATKPYPVVLQVFN